jgi:hypothetical protein
MLNEYDSVKLTKPLSNGMVPPGSHGVVLMVYSGPTPDYEVEFFDRRGNSLGNFTVSESHLELRQSD